MGLWPVSLGAGQTLVISGFASFNGRVRVPVASVVYCRGTPAGELLPGPPLSWERGQNPV